MRLLWNIVLVYLLYFLCRVVYVAEFWDIYGQGFGALDIGSLLWGAFRFDTAAIGYTNWLYGLLVLLPLSRRVREGKAWQTLCRWIFVVVNALALWTNLFDTIYSRFTGRRTTYSFFSEFSNEGNLGSIVWVELYRHWYLVLIGAAIGAALYFLYRPPSVPKDSRRRGGYLLRGIGGMLLFLLLCFVGIRSGVSYHRPLTLSDANGYVNQAKEANIVLNTPFTLIRTLGKSSFTDPHYLTPEELTTVYTPIHSAGGGSTVRKNVVVIILESFGEEYWGCFNGGRGYTPFLDSLAGESLTFRRCYANGRKSIDAMPSILASIPMFVEPYILTSYANNRITSLASVLGGEGWETAFFHGADNASMGFQSFARTAGFARYYGMDEYCHDPQGGGKGDFDGYWGIWDEEFLQFMGRVLDTLPQPFVAGVFTATSHHPFNIPARYEKQFLGGPLPIHRTIQYADHALRRFFAAARQQAWFENTLFVITADHTNLSSSPAYQTDVGLFRVPVLLYAPGCDTLRGRSAATMQQIDIMPTVLGLLHYPHPYLAFGIDALRTPAQETWAAGYNNGVYQTVCCDTLYQFDGTRVVGVYALAADTLLRHNLAATPAQAAAFGRTPAVRRLKGLVQSYMQRMSANRLTPAAEVR